LCVAVRHLASPSGPPASCSTRDKVVKIIRRRREILRENGEAIIASTHSSDSETKLAKLVLGLPINEQEKIILCWRLEMLKQEEAMDELGLSRASLYGKWVDLKLKLQNLFI
jgi:hypothetical protein